MEIVRVNGEMERRTFNFFKIDFGNIEKDSNTSAEILITGVRGLKGRTTCRCTLSEMVKTGEDQFKVSISYKTNNIGAIKQRVTLTTDEMLEIYFDLVGNVTDKL